MEGKFTAGIRGKQKIINFHAFFTSTFEKLMSDGETPKDLEVPEDFFLIYETPYLKQIKKGFIWYGHQIRIKPRLDLKNQIRLTSYDSDTVYALTF